MRFSPGCNCCGGDIICYFCCCPVAGATVTWTRISTGIVEHTDTTGADGTAPHYDVLHPSENYTVSATKTGYYSTLATTTITPSTVFPIALLLPPTSLTLTGPLGVLTLTLITASLPTSQIWRVCWLVAGGSIVTFRSLGGVCTIGSGNWGIAANFTCVKTGGGSVIPGGALCSSTDFTLQLIWTINFCSGTQTLGIGTCTSGTSQSPNSNSGTGASLAVSTNHVTQPCSPLSVDFNVAHQDGGAVGTTPVGHWVVTQ